MAHNINKMNKNKVLVYTSLSLFFAVLTFVSFIYNSEPDEDEEIVVISLIEEENEHNSSDSVNNIKNADTINNKFVSIEEKNTLEQDSINSIIDQNASLVVENKDAIKSYIDVEDKILIIVGTFREKTNAIALCDKMKNQGFNNASVIFNGRRLYWVTTNIYSDAGKAKKELANFELDGWLKKM